jgi:hypothetical protein
MFDVLVSHYINVYLAIKYTYCRTKRRKSAMSSTYHSGKAVKCLGASSGRLNVAEGPYVAPVGSITNRRNSETLE